MFKSAVENFSSLPLVGNTLNDLRSTLDTGIVYSWNGTSWVTINSKFNIFGQASNTDSLSEGATNLYFTDARAIAAVSTQIDGGTASSVYGGTTPINGGNA